MKGQASVELLIILAVSMVVLGLIISVSNNEITSINYAKANSEAQNTVNKLASTANEVFVSGPGTKKQIFISIPSGIDENKSSISDKTIRLNINGTDVISESQVEVTGSIPTESGGHWIWITSYEGYVLIGDIQIETDKGSIYSTIAQNTSAIENIKVINNTSGNASVSVSYVWTSANVTLQLSSNSFVVPADSNTGIDLNFTSNLFAVGNYSGELIFDVNTIDGAKQIIVPLTLEVIVGESNQPLMIFPDLWSPSIDSGYSDSNNFQVCNTTSTALTNIVFTSSNGDAGDWVQAIPTINSLTGNTCQQITVTIDVPLGSNSDTGTVTASDGINSDFISLNVTVSNMSDNFNFSWSTASFNGGGDRLRNWTIENTSINTSLTISRIIVWDWNETDQDSAIIERVRFDGTDYWNGTANAGEWINVTDFTINASTSFSGGNELRFDEIVNNDGEYFRITFEFSDGSTYTTSTYYTIDSTPPTIMLESPATGYTSNSFSVQFDYTVNDVDSGINFCELIINGIIDQTDNSITEGITQSFTKTFASNGTYYWDVNCTDDYSVPNTGSSDENRTIIINSTGPIIIAFHTFPDTSWSSGTGWLNAWTHSGDSSIRSGGTPYSSPNHLRLRRSTGYAERAVDLSAYTNPRLEFWAKVNSFESGDTTRVSISSNGFIWTIIKIFTSADSDNTYHFYSFDLNAYPLSNNFRIAFDAGMSGRRDYFYVDDINIVQRTP